MAYIFNGGAEASQANFLKKSPDLFYCKSKKREYISTLASTVYDKPIHFWRFFKTKTTGFLFPGILTHNDEHFTTSERKTDVFNNKFFASIFHPATPGSISIGSITCGAELSRSPREWKDANAFSVQKKR